jgi:hypothetical protein
VLAMKCHISADGQILQFIYKDHHPLMDVGFLRTIERATDVRFNPNSMRWGVYEPNSNEKAMEEEFDTRQEAIEAEVRMLETEM